MWWKRMDRFFHVISDLYDKHKIPRTYPVPLEIIAHKLGYDVTPFDITPENEHISGAVYYKEKNIWVNPADITKRQNFTIAHELGHIVLGHEKDSKNSKEYDTRRNLINSGNKDKREIDANEFAAELLMPAEDFKKVWNKTKSIVELSDFFDVSIAATRARMENLKLGYDYEK